MTEFEIPEDLIDHIRAKRCVLFVGAGISRKAGLPGWSDLLKKLLARSIRAGLDRAIASQIEDMVESGDLLEAAWHIRHETGRDQLQAEMNAIFLDDSITPVDIHDLIHSIQPSLRAIVTTNFDTLLDRDAFPIIWNQTDEIARAIRSDEFYIFKAHGTIHNFDTIILSDDDYNRVMAHEAYVEFMRGIFSQKPVLFLGYSLKDPDLKLMLDKLNEVFTTSQGTNIPQRYALMPDISDIEKRRYKKKYNIHIISYHPSDDNHPEVDLFLEQVIQKISADKADTGIPISGHPTIQPNINILNDYLIELKYHNTLPDVIYEGQRYAPPDPVSIYTDLRAYEDSPDVEEKRLIWKYRSNPEQFDSFAREFAHLPSIPQDFNISYYKLSSLFRDHQCVILLGDPGSGKSTFLKYITQSFAQAIQQSGIQNFLKQIHLADNFQAQEANPLGQIQLPIRIPIRHYANERLNAPALALNDYLPLHFFRNDKKHASAWKKLIDRLLQEGKCAILLDGLDEVAQDEDRRNIANEINEFVKLYAQAGNRFVVTSRQPGYRYVQGTFSSSFLAFQIEAMDETEIEDFIQNWYVAAERISKKSIDIELVQLRERAKEQTSDILHKRKQNFPLQRITSNPLLLYNLIMIYSTDGELPDRRTELYDQITRTLLKDWPRRRKTPLKLKYELLKPILNDVAYWIHSNVERRYISPAELEAYFEERLEVEAYPGITSTANQLMEDFLTTSYAQTGIFEERGKGLYGFPHLGFEEYFTACWIIGLDSELARKRIRELLHQPRWRESTLMAISMAPYQARTDWVATIHNVSQYEDVLHRDLLFIADCIIEGVRVKDQFAREIVEELIKCYLDNVVTKNLKILRIQLYAAIIDLSKSLPKVFNTIIAEMIPFYDDAEAALALMQVIENVLPTNGNDLVDTLRSHSHYRYIPFVNQLQSQIYQAAPDKTDLGWYRYRDNTSLRQFMGALFVLSSRWRSALWKPSGERELSNLQKMSPYKQPTLHTIFSLPKTVVSEIETWYNRFYHQIAINKAEEVCAILSTSSQLTSEELLKLFSMQRTIYQASPSESLLEDAAIYWLNQNSIPTKNTINTAMDRLEAGVGELREKSGTHTLLACCEQIGDRLLQYTSNGHSVSDRFEIQSRHLLEVDPAIEIDVFEKIIASLEQRLTTDLLRLLEIAEDRDIFYESALILIQIDDKDIFTEVMSILLRHIEQNSDNKVGYGLLVLANHPDLIRCNTDDEKCYNLLISIMDQAPDKAQLTLDILFTFPVKAPLLLRCWTILSDPEHYLFRYITRRFAGIQSIQGDYATLAAITAGLNNPDLHSHALDLLRYRIISTEPELVYCYILGWLLTGNDDLRHRTATLLASLTVNKNRFMDIPHRIVRQIVNRLELSLPLNRDWSDYAQQPQLIAWLESVLQKHNLFPQSPSTELAPLLMMEDQDTVYAAVISIVLFGDVYSLVLQELLDALTSPDDSIRRDVHRLMSFFSRTLPTDGTSMAVQKLSEAIVAANDRKDGYVATVLTGAYINFQSTYWILRWIEDIDNSDIHCRDVAEQALGRIIIASDEIYETLHQMVTDPSRPLHLRTSILDSICDQFFQGKQDEIVATSLRFALGVPEVELCARAAQCMQYSEDDFLDSHVQLLYSHAMSTDQAPLVRYYALKSLGKLLYKVIRRGDGHQVVPMEESLKTIILQRQQDDLLWKGAACGLASLYHGDENRIEKLSELLVDNTIILNVLLWSAAERDTWIHDTRDEMLRNLYYEWEVRDIVKWIRDLKDIATHRRLVDQMLGILEREVSDINNQVVGDREDDISKPFSGWPLRRIIVIILAELTRKDVFSTSILTTTYTAQQVLAILTAIARDPDSFNVRRFAIRILGELQTLNLQVVDALFAGHQDIDTVYIDAYNSAQKFRKFEANSLDKLVDSLNNASVLQASVSALLLGGLGTQLSSDQSIVKDTITDALYRILARSDQRTADLASVLPDFDSAFYDIVFEALLKIVSGQDFERWIPDSASYSFLDTLNKNIQLDVTETWGLAALAESASEPSDRNPLRALGDLNQLRRQAEQMQEELAAEELEASEGNITVTITGDQTIESILVDGENQEDLVTVVNVAIKKSQELSARKLEEMTGGLSGLAGQASMTTLRRQAKQMQEELAAEELEASEGNITVTITGDQKIIAIVVDGQPYETPIAILNQAIKKSQEVAAKKLQEMTGDRSSLMRRDTTRELDDVETPSEEIVSRANPLRALGDLNQLRRQAKQMQEELNDEMLPVFSEDGNISVVISGSQTIESILVDGENQEDLVTVVNAAIKKSQEVAAQKLQEMTGGLSGLIGSEQEDTEESDN